MTHLYYAVELQKKLQETGDSAALAPEIIRSYQAYLNIYQKDPIAYVRLADMEWKFNKNYSIAQQYMENALQLDPKNRYVYFASSNFYLGIGDTARLRMLMDKMRVEVPDAYDPYLFYGFTAYKKGDHSESVYWLEKAVRLGAQEPQAFSILSGYYEKNGLTEKLDSLRYYIGKKH
jgi:tetratricopeptide (TPR) repeat protein